MDLFDLHCDTLYECLNTNQGLDNNNLAISLDKGKTLNKWCQTFAVFTPDNIRCDKAVEHYNSIVALFNNQCKIHSDKITKCFNYDDIIKANSEHKCAAILSVESGAILGGKLDRVDQITNDGVKIFGLTWNEDNELASGIFGKGGGLTRFGVDVVNRLNQLNVLIDVSHLNERGFWQLIELGINPIIATHSNLRSIKNHKRNLTDEQFVAICKTGGVVGINYYNQFLGNDCFDKIYKNICLMLDLGGENHIAFGSDFDGCEIENTLNSIDKFNDLCNYLIQRGLSDNLLDKLCYNNALNMFK